MSDVVRGRRGPARPLIGDSDLAQALSASAPRAARAPPSRHVPENSSTSPSSSASGPWVRSSAARAPGRAPASPAGGLPRAARTRRPRSSRSTARRRPSLSRSTTASSRTLPQLHVRGPRPAGQLLRAAAAAARGSKTPRPAAPSRPPTCARPRSSTASRRSSTTTFGTATRSAPTAASRWRTRWRPSADGSPRGAPHLLVRPLVADPACVAPSRRAAPDDPAFPDVGRGLKRAPAPGVRVLVRGDVSGEVGARSHAQTACWRSMSTTSKGSVSSARASTRCRRRRGALRVRGPRRARLGPGPRRRHRRRRDGRALRPRTCVTSRPASTRAPTSRRNFDSLELGPGCPWRAAWTGCSPASSPSAAARAARSAGETNHAHVHAPRRLPRSGSTPSRAPSTEVIFRSGQLSGQTRFVEPSRRSRPMGASMR